jgi:hypothetical protein
MKLLAIPLALVLVGCPPSEKRSPTDAAAGACSKVGQTCEVSPGKLGTCVSQDSCPTPGGCFVCQSQH